MPISGRGSSFSQNSELYQSTMHPKRQRQVENHVSQIFIIGFNFNKNYIKF